MIVNGTDMLYMDSIDDNYIREFDARVRKISEDGKGHTYIVLDRSAFYPEGGGQPTDTGTLQWVDDTVGELRSIEIERVAKKNQIRHYPVDPKGLAGLEPGQDVKGVLDWERRYGHMKMHTSQHLISAVAYDLYGAFTVGNQIYADHSRIDFSPLAHEDVEEEKIEEQCNSFIRANPSVKVVFTDRSVLEGTGDAVRCNLHLLPKSVTNLRIVKIEEVELCPCAGTHVRTLVELGKIKITKVRSKGKGRARITYELVDCEGLTVKG